MWLIFQETPRVAAQNERVFRRIVKAAFAQRRRTLRNALQAAGYNDLTAIGVRTRIGLQRWGKTLALDEFEALTNAFAKP